jgi:hypothetical protein
MDYDWAKNYWYGTSEPHKDPSKHSSPACFMVVSCLAYSLTLKMEATCSPKRLSTFRNSPTHAHVLYDAIIPSFLSKFQVLAIRMKKIIEIACLYVTPYVLFDL